MEWELFVTNENKVSNFTPDSLESKFLEHVYMRPELNSNRFQISLRGRNSLRCSGNFIIIVHMTSDEVRLTSVQISLWSIWPKWNFKPQWVFHVKSKMHAMKSLKLIPTKHSSWWRRLQDVLIKTNIFALVISLQKTSSRRLGQDQYICLGHTSSRRLQEVLERYL